MRAISGGLFLISAQHFHMLVTFSLIATTPDWLQCHLLSFFFGINDAELQRNTEIQIRD